MHQDPQVVHASEDLAQGNDVTLLPGFLHQDVPLTTVRNGSHLHLQLGGRGQEATCILMMPARPSYNWTTSLQKDRDSLGAVAVAAHFIK